MYARVRWATAASISALFAMTVLAACGGSDGDAEASAPPSTEAEVVTTTAPTVEETGWQDDVAAHCDTLVAALESVPPAAVIPDDLPTFIAGVQAAVAGLPGLDEIAVPNEVQAEWDNIVEMGEGSEAALDEAAVASDLAAVDAALSEATDKLNRTYGLIALAGARCGVATPERASAGALNITTEGEGGQIAAGFDSIWISERLRGRVVRIDPESGETLATIDVGAGPLKLQPADGRMWVRTMNEFVAIDPATDTVVARLAKSDVGPAVNRNWVVDGAMWICDGQRLHRYDPTTLQPVTTIELGIDCGQPYATEDQVAAFTYNEDEGESGTSAAVLVDPATNEASRPVALPVDVIAPVVLDEVVFFPGNFGSKAVVVDRETATVTATPDLGRPTGGSLSITDGERIYVPTTRAEQDVLVVDASTYEVVDTIEPLGNNTLALLDGSLWTAAGHYGLMQRFDDVSG